MSSSRALQAGWVALAGRGGLEPLPNALPQKDAGGCRLRVRGEIGGDVICFVDLVVHLAF